MGVDHPGLGMTMGDLVRTIRRIARQTIQNASIGRAGIRVYDGGWIRIEDGGLQVTGTATVTGRLEGSGTFDWTGPMNLKGAQNVTGPTTFVGKVNINGDVDINGPLNVLGVWKLTGNGDITGNVNLTGNMAVKSGGSITVQGGGGNVTLSSTYGSPRINLGGAQIDGGSSSITFTAGSTTIYMQNGTIRIAGMPTRPSSDYPGSFTNAVVADSGGNLYRIV